MMTQSRRAFLGIATGWVASAALLASAQAAQREGPFGRYPVVVPFSRDELSVKPDPKWLKAKQKSVRKDAARLSQLARQLQKEVDKNNTVDVLPVDVLRKAAEIEKLAKQIKNAVHG